MLGRGLKVGKSFKVQGADGSAWYEVTHVGPASVDVEWRDYGLDRCMDEMLAAGGEFPRPLIGGSSTITTCCRSSSKPSPEPDPNGPVLAPVACGANGRLGPSSGLTERASTK